VVIDSRSCRSAPSCFARGIDGGKKVRGVKIQMDVEKYGIPLAIEVAPANRHDTKARGVRVSNSVPRPMVRNNGPLGSSARPAPLI
jgi:hypothetical protein